MKLREMCGKSKQTLEQVGGREKLRDTSHTLKTTTLHRKITLRDDEVGEQDLGTDMIAPNTTLGLPHSAQTNEQNTPIGTQADIQLLTVRGDIVGLDDALWVRIPYPHALYDSVNLLGVAPGHCHL
jgi:hypothetical protein